MKRISKKRAPELDEFPSSDLRHARMLAYLDASRGTFANRVEKATHLGIKANGLLAGPTANSKN